MPFEIPGRSASVTFASAVVAVLDPRLRFVRYAAAGHDIGVIAHGRAHRHLVPTGPVLGVIDGRSGLLKLSNSRLKIGSGRTTICLNADWPGRRLARIELRNLHEHDDERGDTNRS